MHVSTRLVLVALGALLMPHFAAAQDEEVELNVRNQTSERMTVFALWQTGTRTRLGDLDANQTGRFTIPVRGQEVTLGVRTEEVRQVRGGDNPADFASVQAGDRVEWEIREADPLRLDYQRFASASGPPLPSASVASVFSGDIEPQEPRVSRYTALSAMRIQEAQSTDVDSLRAQSYSEALEAIYDGLARENDNPEAYLHLGIVQAALSNYLVADSAFDRAEAFYPEYMDEERGTRVHRFNGWVQAYNEATARVDAQDPEGAVELFRTANVLFDKRPEAYLNLGAQTAALGDLEESIEAWQSAIAVIESPDADPLDDETRQSWDTNLWTMAHTNLGRVLQMSERLEEAVTVYQTLLERYPDDSQARSSLAMVLAQTGQGDDALSIFDEILDSEDSPPLDYFNAAVSLYQAEQFDKAVVGFTKAVERVPMYRDGLQNLSQTLNLLEDYEGQVPYSERLLELDPHSTFAYQMHIRAMVQVGREPEGVALLDIMQALPFEIDGLQLQPMASGASVSGTAINKTLEPGTSITLRFTFYDNDGSPVGSEDVEVTISDPDVAHTFQVAFDGETQLLGYGYEFVS